MQQQPYQIQNQNHNHNQQRQQQVGQQGSGADMRAACPMWASGTCNFGDKCKFSHNDPPAMQQQPYQIQNQNHNQRRQQQVGQQDYGFARNAILVKGVIAQVPPQTGQGKQMQTLGQATVHMNDVMMQDQENLPAAENFDVFACTKSNNIESSDESAGIELSAEIKRIFQDVPIEPCEIDPYNDESWKEEIPRNAPIKKKR